MTTAVSNSTASSNTGLMGGLFQGLGFADYGTIGGSFRDRTGESLFKNEYRRRQYTEDDMASVRSVVDRKLAEISEAAGDVKEEDVALRMTGREKNRTAKSVSESFRPTSGNDLRLSIPLRA